MKLLEAMVESVLLYEAEVWGYCKQMEALEQVQLRAARVFLGVGSSCQEWPSKMK